MRNRRLLVSILLFAGVLAPFTGMLLAGAWLTRRLSWRQAVVGLAVWAVVAGLTVLLLYWTVSGLPVGAQLIGPIGDDITVLKLARQLEQAKPWADKRPPVHAGEH